MSRKISVAVLLLGLFFALLSVAQAAEPRSGGELWEKLRLHRRKAVSTDSSLPALPLDLYRVAPAQEDKQSTKKLLDEFFQGVRSEIAKAGEKGKAAVKEIEREMTELTAEILGEAAPAVPTPKKEKAYLLKPFKPADEKVAVAVPISIKDEKEPAPAKDSVATEQPTDQANDDSWFGTSDDWMPVFCDDEAGECLLDDEAVFVFGKSLLGRTLRKLKESNRTNSFPFESLPPVICLAFFLVPVLAAVIAARIHRNRMQQAGYVVISHPTVFGVNQPVWAEADEKQIPVNAV